MRIIDLNRLRSIRARAGFTIVELLVVISIIGLLIGILLPALSSARDSSLVSQSEANLRNLGAAHATYAAEWNGRQFTLAKDDLAAYGGSDHRTVLTNYLEANGDVHPYVSLGWGNTNSGAPIHWFFRISIDGNWDGRHYYLLAPATMDRESPVIGSFRMANSGAFHPYVTGRFFDRVFYAPKDRWVLNALEGDFQLPADDHESHINWDLNIPWSSYCMSPAGMWNPAVLRRPSRGGYQCPWELPASYRSPSYAQARYPSLKTHMLEHHWLQNLNRDECNPNMNFTRYDDCEPFYFNHSPESAPVTLFYDGHIRLLSVSEVRDAQLRLIAQTTGTASEGDVLFFGDGEDTNPAGPICEATDGYFEDDGFLFTGGTWDLSWHIFTVDGILGRDTLSQ